VKNGRAKSGGRIAGESLACAPWSFEGWLGEIVCGHTAERAAAGARANRCVVGGEEYVMEGEKAECQS
jgi:hypothetical protein